MTVHIDRMESSVEVDGGPSASQTRDPLAEELVAARDRERLKALLRPVVLEILGEALADTLRVGG